MMMSGLPPPNAMPASAREAPVRFDAEINIGNVCVDRYLYHSCMCVTYVNIYYNLELYNQLVATHVRDMLSSQHCTMLRLSPPQSRCL